MLNLTALTYEQTMAHLDRVMEQARAFDAARAEREQMARQARRDLLVARGEARAARGRFYNMIQTGRLP